MTCKITGSGDTARDYWINNFIRACLTTTYGGGRQRTQINQPMAHKKKLPPLVNWTLDCGFWSYEITVKARTKGEARKKAMARLKKTPATKFLNKQTTFLDKDD